MTTDQLRKRAEELAVLRGKAERMLYAHIPRAFLTQFAKQDAIAAMLAFAAEQREEARAEAIAECAKVCRDLNAFNEDDPGESAAQAIEAIARMTPAADMVLVPREPTPEMRAAGNQALFDAGLRTFPDCFAVYKAMIAKAG